MPLVKYYWSAEYTEHRATPCKAAANMTRKHRCAAFWCMSWMSFRKSVLGSTTSQCVFRHQRCPPQQSLPNSETKPMFSTHQPPGTLSYTHTAVINTHRPNGTAPVMSIWVNHRRNLGWNKNEEMVVRCPKSSDQTCKKPAVAGGFCRI